jgi:hypothetical protein
VAELAEQRGQELFNLLADAGSTGGMDRLHVSESFVVRPHVQDQETEHTLDVEYR